MLTPVCKHCLPKRTLDVPPPASVSYIALQQSLAALPVDIAHALCVGIWVLMSEVIHDGHHTVTKFTTEKILLRRDEAKNMFKIRSVHTSSKCGIFQTVTMSLCIANKHFRRLRPRKCIPDAIAFQYSGFLLKNIDKLHNPLTLFPLPVIVMSVRTKQLPTEQESLLY